MRPTPPKAKLEDLARALTSAPNVDFKRFRRHPPRAPARAAPRRAAGRAHRRSHTRDRSGDGKEPAVIGIFGQAPIEFKLIDPSKPQVREVQGLV
jgi:hypothetical protein